MSILVLGTVALDTIKTPHGSRADLMGGSAAHFAMAASHFCPTHIAAVIGHDFPKKNLLILKRKGIALNSVTAADGGTFKWSGEYRTGELDTAYTLNTHLGVISSIQPRPDAAQRGIKTVFLANYDPDIQSAFLAAMNRPEFVGLDTMNFWIQQKRSSLVKIIKRINLLTINEAEAKALSGEHSLPAAARNLSGCGPQIVIIKKGEHGVLIYTKTMISALPAFPVRTVIDPTGAGDTFAGAVMGYLARTRRRGADVLRKAIAYGTICASFNVQGFGLTKTARLTSAQIEERLQHFRLFFSGI